MNPNVWWGIELLCAVAVIAVARAWWRKKNRTPPRERLSSRWRWPDAP